jgi:hypothetical protein
VDVGCWLCQSAPHTGLHDGAGVLPAEGEKKKITLSNLKSLKMSKTTRKKTRKKKKRRKKDFFDHFS